ncbi:hypothetical protein HK104_005411 [Borealophlyctis nickersoniae]|nr:hypothetical protein HK104_005411 [Borealophlyctis nickersoniae]
MPYSLRTRTTTDTTGTPPSPTKSRAKKSAITATITSDLDAAQKTMHNRLVKEIQTLVPGHEEKPSEVVAKTKEKKGGKRVGVVSELKKRGVVKEIKALGKHPIKRIAKTDVRHGLPIAASVSRTSSGRVTKPSAKAAAAAASTTAGGDTNAPARKALKNEIERVAAPHSPSETKNRRKAADAKVMVNTQIRKHAMNNEIKNKSPRGKSKSPTSASPTKAADPLRKVKGGRVAK